MTDVRDDIELTAAMRALPTPTERAALLGLDYRALRRTARRVSWGTAAISAVLIVAVLMPGSFIAGGTVVSVGPILAAVLLGFAVQFLVLLAVQMFMWSTTGRVAVGTVQVLATALGIPLLVLALTVAVAANPDTPEALVGLLVGTILGASMWSIAPGTLASGIKWKWNSRGVVTVFRHHSALPGWQTLLGGQARWVIAEHAVRVVADTAVVLIVSANLAFAAPVALLYAGAYTVAVIQGLTGNRLRYFAILASAAAALDVAAMLVRLA